MDSTLPQHHNGAERARPRFSAARRRGLARFYPRKVIHWVALGIALVLLPLLLAVGSAAHYVQQLAVDSQDAVLDGTQSVKLSRMLGDYLLGMERNARVYQVVGDTKLLTTYQQLHTEFRHSASELIAVESDEAVLDKIEQLLAIESELHDVLTQEPPNSSLAINSLQRFAEMREIIRWLVDRNGEVIRERIQQLHNYATEAQQVLLWQSFMVLPVAIGLGLLIIYRVSRPMKELDRSIRRLGSNDVDEEIRVHGPDDIRALGSRLEWLRQRLRELADQKRLFLQHISHELKTPLASIREGASLLNGDVVGQLNEQQKEVVDILESSSLQLQRRIEDLLAFSVNDEPRAELELKRLSAERLVRSIIDCHQLVIRSKGLTVDLRFDDRKVFADKEKLHAIVDNLISNAVKFSPEGGCIQIIQTEQNGRWQLDIHDQGPGVHPTEVEQIFQPFYQGSAPSSGHLKGTGLGLAIARLYARLHQGDLIVLPSSHGAHLQLSLPVANKFTANTNANGAETCT
ncbi:two-component system sensor histidine kinase GlrK [Litorivivens lipolytica]|uniref:histidine kinase n=1 Tax=Litorivivens lipolytica TaxID=1524264 RepID=A0A7W4W5P0_9GAMM|nr:HAMP domain-containing sensor histidine kinase [Litorivivens lipolytica]MBB3047563.1 two-component system sensor histidine kinase GlrK [Litorivivens lipolytica]